MTRKIPDDKILYAKSLVENGSTIKAAAIAIDVSADHLSHRLRALGVNTIKGKFGNVPANRLKLDDAEIIRRYQSGESVLSLSKAFGVNRFTINQRLKENNVAIRNGSEANIIRMSRMTFDERRSLSKEARAAHIKSIMTTADHYSVGPGEHEIAQALSALGHEVRTQTPLDNGCIDITIGKVAIEVKMNSGGSYDFRRQRVEQLIKSGYSTIFIGFNHLDCIAERLEEIVALADFACRHPTALGQHWVIRCRCYKSKGRPHVYDTTIERRSNDLP
jgi:hypothetical protein